MQGRHTTIDDAETVADSARIQTMVGCCVDLDREVEECGHGLALK